MDQSAINEGNALIAEFLGWKKDNGDMDYYTVPAPFAIQVKAEYTAYEPIEMNFHKDWNWTKLAWIKFRDLSYEAQPKIENEHAEWCYSLTWYLYSADVPLTFFDRLTYAIKWHNTL